MADLNIIVIGGGAIGRFMAVLLAPHGNLILVPSSRAYPALKEGELSVSGLITKKAKVKVKELQELSQDKMRKAFVVVCVKAFDTEAILTSIAPLVGKESLICLMQNGLGIGDLAKALISTGVPCVRAPLRLGSRSVSPTEVECTGIRDVMLAPCAPHAKESAEKIGDLLKRAQIPAAYRDSVLRVEWEKCLINVLTNSICTLLEGENGIITADPSARLVAERLLKETSEVAREEGVIFSDPELANVFETIDRVAANTNSTLIDIRAGRRTETDYLLGAVVRRARERKIEVSCAETILALLLAKERLSGSRKEPA